MFELVTENRYHVNNIYDFLAWLIWPMDFYFLPILIAINNRNMANNTNHQHYYRSYHIFPRDKTYTLYQGQGIKKQNLVQKTKITETISATNNFFIRKRLSQNMIYTQPI